MWPMPSHPLLEVEAVDLLEPYLEDVGSIFRAFHDQDSGCQSYGVAVGDERWFVKGATTPQAASSLRRVVDVHGAVQHSAIVPLRHHFQLRDGLALVYPWAEGEVLYHDAVELRPDPGGGPLGEAPVRGRSRRAEDRRQLPPGAARRGHEDDRREDLAVPVPAPASALRPGRSRWHHPLEQFPQFVRHHALNHHHTAQTTQQAK